MLLPEELYNNKIKVRQNIHDSFLEKGKKANIGDIHNFKGIQYQKQQDGTWKVYEAVKRKNKEGKEQTVITKVNLDLNKLFKDENHKKEYDNQLKDLINYHGNFYKLVNKQGSSNEGGRSQAIGNRNQKFIGTETYNLHPSEIEYRNKLVKREDESSIKQLKQALQNDNYFGKDKKDNNKKTLLTDIINDKISKDKEELHKESGTNKGNKLKEKEKKLADKNVKLNKDIDKQNEKQTNAELFNNRKTEIEKKLSNKENLSKMTFKRLKNFLSGIKNNSLGGITSETPLIVTIKGKTYNVTYGELQNRVSDKADHPVSSDNIPEIEKIMLGNYNRNSYID